MENYDLLYFQQLAPLIAFEGLNSSTAAPIVDLLLENLKISDITGKVWDNCILKNRLLNQKYLITQVSTPDYIDQLIKAKDPEVHSLASPFNVESELFPNGILDLHWFKKYTELRPFAYIAVFEIGLESEDEEKILQLIKLKAKLQQAGIKFVGIVLCSVDGTDERILKLRQATGLTRLSGLLSINIQSATLEKDIELLVVNLLSNLKSSSTEFYTGIESKIKQRNKKYYSIPSSSDVDTTIELTPQHLETRNLLKLAIISQYAHPHNLEVSIKPFEEAYQHLVEILHHNYFEFAKDRISTHDMKFYKQLRILIDVTAFHIVRAYLSIEDPLTALKKHAAHILNVSTAARKKIDLSEWFSIQYEWLASLLLLVPQSIVQSANLSISNKKLKTSKLVGFLGGVRFEKEDALFDILTEPSLVYLKAAYYISDSLIKPLRQLDFLSNANSKELIIAKRLRLLLKASETSTPSGSNNQLEVYSSLLGHIHFLIAEEYLKRGSDDDIQRATEYYDSSLHHLPIEWTYITETISTRLMECYNKLKVPEDVLKCALLLSTVRVSAATEQLEPIKINLDSISESSIEVGANMSPIFQVGVVFFNQNMLKNSTMETFVHDILITQLFIKPIFSVDSLKACFEHDVEVGLQISELRVEFERVDRKDVLAKSGGLNDVTITHSREHEDQKFQNIEDTEEISANLSFKGNEGKLFEIAHEIKKAGTYLVKGIYLLSEIVLKHGEKQITILDKQELHRTFFMEKSRSLYQWYHKLVNNKLVKVPLKLDGVKHNTLRVMPIKPEVVVHLKTADINNIILGEKIALKFQISWKGLKDDEALQLVDMKETSEVELSLSIRSASLHSEEIIMESSKSYRVVIDMKTIVSEKLDDVEQEVAVYDTANYVLPINNKPFDFKFGITPKYSETAHDMPCPFILQEDHEGSSLPIVTRLWGGNLGVSEIADFEIRLIDFTIKSKNPEVLVEVLETDSLYSQAFTTRSRNGVAHRNVTIMASVEAEWCRKNSMHLNQYKSSVWEIQLPLADPRVLHEVQDVNKEDKTCKLVYIIENPTPRTFTFSTKLVDDNDRFIWNLEDKRNIFPLTQNRVPVLPFSRFVMEYYANFSAATEKTIQLPQFKTYDIQYKVALPTLPVSKDISVKLGGALYWSAGQ